MSKRGQVTIVIVIGVFLLLSLVLILFLRTDITQPIVQTDSIKSTLTTGIESCLEQTTLEVLPLIGIQGGYYEIPPNAFRHEYHWASFYMKNGEPTIPSREILQEQLALGIKEEIDPCLRVVIQNHPTVTYSLKKINTQIHPGKIVIDAEIPVTIGDEIVDYSIVSNQGLLTQITSFTKEIPIDYYERYNFANEIILLQSQHPVDFPFGEVAFRAVEKNFQYVIIPSPLPPFQGEIWDEEFPADTSNDHNRVLVSIMDNEKFTQPYYFTFGIETNVDYESIFGTS